MTTKILARAPLVRGEMQLERIGKHVAICIGDRTLMSSDVHDSEDELGHITAAGLRVGEIRALDCRRDVDLVAVPCSTTS